MDLRKSDMEEKKRERGGERIEKEVTFSMHLRSVLTFLTHQPIPIALSSDHWGSPLWIAGIILMSSSSASEWKAQAKWQVDTPKLEACNNNLRNYINNNKTIFCLVKYFFTLKSLFKQKERIKELCHHSGLYSISFWFMINDRTLQSITFLPSITAFFKNTKVKLLGNDLV